MPTSRTRVGSFPESNRESRTAELPELDSGLVCLSPPSPRSIALHRLIIDSLGADEQAYWIDARNTASTYALYELIENPRRISGIRIARAFTAYQHHTLVRTTVQKATSETALVVAPNVASLYRDDDVPDHERRDLLDAALRMLSELGAVLDIPILVTDHRDDALSTSIADRAAMEIKCTRTEQGLRYSTEDFETTVYWCDGYWQTTIPYWVDLLGAVDETTHIEAIGEYAMPEV